MLADEVILKNGKTAFRNATGGVELMKAAVAPYVFSNLHMMLFTEHSEAQDVPWDLFSDSTVSWGPKAL